MPLQSDDQVVFYSAKLTIDGQVLLFLSSEKEGITYHGFAERRKEPGWAQRTASSLRRAGREFA